MISIKMYLKWLFVFINVFFPSRIDPLTAFQTIKYNVQGSPIPFRTDWPGVFLNLCCWSLGLQVAMLKRSHSKDRASCTWERVRTRGGQNPLMTSWYRVRQTFWSSSIEVWNNDFSKNIPYPASIQTKYSLGPFNGLPLASNNLIWSQTLEIDRTDKKRNFHRKVNSTIMNCYTYFVRYHKKIAIFFFS